MTGMVGNAWELEQFSPMGAIPSTVNLTTYSGGTAEFVDTPLQTVVSEIEAGRMTLKIGPVFQLDDIVEAHRCMEDNAASGKIVVLT
jgi:NADPH:quinone reductase-like Zn-dependent oxidoreductase